MGHVAGLGGSVAIGSPYREGKMRRKLGLGAVPVGRVFEILPGEDVEVFVVALPPQDSSDDTRQRLQGGARVAFDGPLLFEAARPLLDVRASQVVHRVMVDGWWCISSGTLLENKVDVGKIGYVNQWSPVAFQLPVTNGSDIPLLLSISVRPARETTSARHSLDFSRGPEVPPAVARLIGLARARELLSPSSDEPSAPTLGVGGGPSPKAAGAFIIPGVSVSADAPRSSDTAPPLLAANWGDEGCDPQEGAGYEPVARVDPLAVGNVEGVIHPAVPVALEGGDRGPRDRGDGVCNWTVTLTNVFNPDNFLRFSLSAHVISSTLLRFNGRQLSESSSGGGFMLDLPEMLLPSPPDAKCNELFTVTNLSDEPVELHAFFEPEANIAAIMTVDLLSSSTSTHVHSFSLARTQTMQMAVLCKGREDVFLVPSGLDRKQITLGKITIQSVSFPSESITVRGCLIQGKTLAAERERLSLTAALAPEETTLSISNLCGAPLPFQVEPIIPPELAQLISVSVEPLHGTMEAFGTATLRITVVRRSESSGPLGVGETEEGADLLGASPLPSLKELPPIAILIKDTRLVINPESEPAIRTPSSPKPGSQGAPPALLGQPIGKGGGGGSVDSMSSAGAAAVQQGAEGSSHTANGSSGGRENSSNVVRENSSNVPRENSSNAGREQAPRESLKDAFVKDLQARKGPGTLVVLGEVRFDSGGEEQRLGAPSRGGRGGADVTGVKRVGKKEGKRNAPPCIIVRGCTELAEAGGASAPEEGARSVKARYEVNIGQQNIEEGDVEWSITLEYEGSGGGPLRYDASALCKEDAAWLSLKNESGSLEAPGDSVSLTMALSTASMGVFSTYILIDNLDNPFDRKTVRVTMEVVGSKKAAGTAGEAVNWFTVHAAELSAHLGVDADAAGGAERIPTTDFGHVFYSQVYCQRSFIIRNEAAIPLEFTVTSNLHERSATAELAFSLNHTSLTTFRVLTIQPKALARVFVFFCPGPAPPEVVSQATGVLWEPASTPLDATGVRIDFEVYVRCRLVKDFQKVMRFEADCFLPRLNLAKESKFLFSSTPAALLLTQRTPPASPSTNFPPGGRPPEAAPADLFLGAPAGSGAAPPTPGGSALQPRQQTGGGFGEYQPFFHRAFSPACFILPLDNDSSNRPLPLSLWSPSFFFDVSLVELPPDILAVLPGEARARDTQRPMILSGDVNILRRIQDAIPELRTERRGSDREPLSILIPPASTRHLLVSLDVAALSAKPSSILKHRYFQEVAFLYNRDNIAENYTLSLRLAAATNADFSVTPGPRSSYTYLAMERAILTFLDQYNLAWHKVLSAMPKVDEASEQEGLPVGAAGPASGTGAPDAGGPASGVGAIHGQTSVHGQPTAGGAGEAGDKAGTAAGARPDKASVAWRKATLLSAEKAAKAILAGGEGLEKHPDLHLLAFQMHAIVTAIVNFGVRDEGLVVFKLVSLLFSSIFRHPSFSPFITIASEQRRAAQRRKQRPTNLASLGPASGDPSGSSESVPDPSPELVGWIPQLPPVLQVMLQELTYILSYFPVPVDQVADLRRTALDLSRLTGGDTPGRDSREFGALLGPVPTQSQPSEDPPSEQPVERRPSESLPSESHPRVESQPSESVR